MVSVLIKSDDNYWKFGLLTLISESFKSLEQRVKILPAFTKDAIIKADLIFVELRPGENVKLIPNLCLRKGTLFIIERKKNIIAHRLSGCQQDIVHLTKDEAVYKLRSKIMYGWNQSSKFSDDSETSFLCTGCKCTIFTSIQLKILSMYYNGMTIKEIAAERKLSIKTIYAHKDYIMKSLNIKSDHELYSFLKKYIP